MHVTSPLTERTESLNYFHVKKQIIHAARTTKPLQAPYTNILLFSDLSKATMELRRAFTPITSILQERKITYKWGFPTKLLVTHQQQTIPILTPKEGYKKFTNWGFLPLPPNKTGRMESHPNPPPSRNLAPDKVGT